jgi:hypothetical protein
MTTPPMLEPMPQLPRTGKKVRWRNPQAARAWGWEDVLGPGPFAVVRLVDNSAYGLGAGLILRTELGEREISEVWLALAEESEPSASGRRQVVG